VTGNERPCLPVDQTENRRSRLSLAAAAGWDILVHAFRNFRFHEGVNLAAAIAFYAILSIIPLLTLTILLLSKIFGSNPAIKTEIGRVIQLIHPRFPLALLDQVTIAQHKERILGWVGIIALIWASSLIFSSIEAAFGIIFRSHKTRNQLVSKLLALTIIPLGLAVAACSMAISYISSLVGRYPLLFMRVSIVTKLIDNIMFQYLLPFLLLVSFFTVVYKVIPTTRVRLRYALAGGFLFSMLMEVAKGLFAWYLSGNTQYHLIYGPLATLVSLVIWVFYVAVLLLFCGELIASYKMRDLILLEKAFLKERRTT
jgi:membrane protein